MMRISIVKIEDSQEARKQKRMIKILSFASLLCCFVSFLIPPSHAADYFQVISDDNHLIYVDIESIERRDDYVVAWSQWIPRGESLKAYEAPAEYTMTFCAYNLKSKQFKSLETIVYGHENEIVNRLSIRFAKSQYQEVIPATYGESIYSFVMLAYRRKEAHKEAENAVRNAKIQYGTKIVRIADRDFRFPDRIPDDIISSAIRGRFYSEALREALKNSGWSFAMIKHELNKEIYGKTIAEQQERDVLQEQAYEILDGNLTISETLRPLIGAIVATLFGFLLLYMNMRKIKTFGNDTVVAHQEEGAHEFFNSSDESTEEEMPIPENVQTKTVGKFKATGASIFIAIAVMIGFFCFALFLQAVFKPNGGIIGSIVTGIISFLVVLLLLHCFPKKITRKARNKIFIFITIGIISALLGSLSDVTRFLSRNGLYWQEEAAHRASSAALFYTALIYLGMSSIAIVLRFFVLRFLARKKPLLNFIISLACSGVMLALSIDPLGVYLAGELFYTWVYVMTTSDGVASGTDNPFPLSLT